MTPSNLVVINGGLALNVPPPGLRKLLHTESYLKRQIKAAHRLGLLPIERYYLTGFLSLQLWLLEQIEIPEGSDTLSELQFQERKESTHMSLNFHCLVCTQAIPEERARHKAKFCSDACRFEAERRLKGIRTTKAKRSLQGAIPRVESPTKERAS